ncbi:MAG: cysteine desulfurase [Clostridia bacterium]|nr:cysteine desulfurase [Clostridia bacterium]
MKETIYFDNASTTPLDQRVLNAMTPYLTEVYGNANSVHSVGRRAVKGLDEAREKIAYILGADFNEIYFTSGGTEGDNLALRGSFLSRLDGKDKLVISSIEHSAVLSTALQLETQGAKVVRVKPDCKGYLSVADYEKELTSDCFLACMMYANNELGTIQPVKEFARACNERGILSFTDAVQAVGVERVNVKELGVSMLSLSGHKFGAPKGVGVLYVKNGVKLSPIISGGHQERSKRGGTSNVAGAVGLAKALELSRENLAEETAKIRELKTRLVAGILREIPCAVINGGDKTLPGIVNVTFKGVDGEALLYAIDLYGVCASLGAACSAGTIEPSHVLKEIGLSDKDAKSSIRFSLYKQNTSEEVDRVVELLKTAIKKISGR